MGLQDSLYLVGPMGCGKTTIGRRLSRQLNMPFYDSDLEIERRAGVDIALIFEEEGEDKFRHREKQIILELTQLPGIILATGGGSILTAENRQALTTHGCVIYLHSTPEKLYRNIQFSKKTRPLLQDADNMKESITRILKERELLYKEVANITLDIASMNIDSIIKKLCKQYHAFSRASYG